MSSDLPDRDTFAQQMIEALKSAGESANIVYDPEEFQLRVEGEEGRIGNLTNVYNEYLSCTPSQQQQLIRNYVRSWFAPMRELPEDFEDVHPDLLPTVRSRAYIELNLRKWRSKGMDGFGWPYRILGEHLALSLVYDMPGSLMQIQQRHLDDWKVDFDSALERAVDNLAEISNHEFDEVRPGVWQSPWKDNLDPSRLVLPGLLVAHEITGDPVVMIPNRDTLLLTGADDTEGLNHLIELAEEAFEHARPVTGIALRWVPDGWVEFLPSEDHPAHSRYRIMQVKSIAHDYAEQKEMLDEIFEESGEDFFVASYSALQEKNTGQVYSYAVWSEGVDTYLPRTDRVFFVHTTEPEDDEEEADCEVVAIVTWAKVIEHFEDLMTQVEEYPPRWRVTEFPPLDLLSQLDERPPETN